VRSDLNACQAGTHLAAKKDSSASGCRPAQWYGGCLTIHRMPSAPKDKLHPSPNPKTDLFFNCEGCGIPLVVDSAAAGMTLSCQRCGHPTKVPTSITAKPLAEIPPAATSEEKTAELQRRLKENESQRTEIGGYINQLNIQLHRWQLRLQTLDDRNTELKAEIAGLAAPASSAPQ
jgi:hypothetical protein